MARPVGRQLHGLRPVDILLGQLAAMPSSPDQHWYSNIKLGAGLVGKTGTVTAIFELVCIAGLATLPPELKLWALVAAVLGIGGFLILAFRWGEKNPILAALDGVQAVRYLEADAAAKDPKIIDAIPNSRQNTAPPRAMKGRQTDA